MAWRFTEVDVVGKQPPPRHMHASAVIDGALYVVGGQHRLDVLQDAWTLRIDDRPYDWRKLKLQKAGRLLKHRIFFAHAAYGSKLYLSGGANHQNMSEPEPPARPPPTRQPARLLACSPASLLGCSPARDATRGGCSHCMRHHCPPRQARSSTTCSCSTPRPRA